MNAFKKVLNDLYANQEITVVDIQTTHFDLFCSDLCAEAIKIVVAPKKGLYTAVELQELMLHLTKQTPSTKDSFTDYENRMEFGKLYFDEKIGVRKTRTETVITDDSILAKNPEGFEQGRRIAEYERELTRRTWVYLYPNVQIALRAVHDGEDIFGIDRIDLDRFRGRTARLIVRLEFQP